MDEELDEYSARVLDVVDAIPPGQVMSYGDIAEYLAAGGPRQVGRVLAAYGGGVAWWRVIHADGTPAPGHDASALKHYLAGGSASICAAPAGPATGYSPGLWRPGGAKESRDRAMPGTRTGVLP
jgi:alkylated DNA nucleotide flippase Atl1